jgi:sugar phosphate isomerase/epimerase
MSSPNGMGDGLGRRDFLRVLPAAAAGAWALAGEVNPALAARAPARRALGRVGLQLYTVRAPMSEDVESTLAAVANIGYQEVEFAGLHGRSPQDMRRLLDDLGLRAASSHQSLADIRGDWQGVLEAAVTLGQTEIVCPSIPPDERSLDGYRRVADDFNRAGEVARSVGIRFAYHNHDFEFVPVDGIVPYDLLLELCDPKWVSMQMDLFWTVHAGKEPLAYFETHPGRFSSVHVKDRTPDGQMVDVGAGVIDFAAIFAQSERAGIRHYFVEHDRPRDPLASARASYEHLSALEA